MTRHVGGFNFFFLDGDGDDRIRDVVLVEPLRPENRDTGGLEGASELESESESSWDKIDVYLRQLRFPESLRSTLACMLMILYIIVPRTRWKRGSNKDYSRR